MRIIEKVTEAEMAAIFLRAEIASSHFGKDILRILEKDGVNRKVIDKPDVNDAGKNEYRAVLLGKFRGYKRNKELFQDFPDDLRWHRVLLDREDLLKVKYMNYSYWNDLSGGTRAVANAAKRILAGEIEDDGGFRVAAKAVKSGEVFEEIIFVSENEQSDLILLEGHLRATAYLMSLDYLPAEMSAIVGYSEQVIAWDVE